MRVAIAAVILAAGTGAGTSAFADNGKAWVWVDSKPPHLAYGATGTDDVDIQLECGADGKVSIHAVSRGDVVLASGGASRTYKGAPTDIDPMTKQAFTAANDPVLKAFARTGQISRPGKPADATTPEDRTAIAAFAKACLR